MVNMNASKNARNAASIINRQNCGGPKKAGLVSKTGFWFLSSNPRLNRAVNVQMRMCIPNRTVQTQRYGYQATLG